MAEKPDPKSDGARDSAGLGAKGPLESPGDPAVSNSRGVRKRKPADSANSGGVRVGGKRVHPGTASGKAQPLEPRRWRRLVLAVAGLAAVLGAGAVWHSLFLFGPVKDAGKPVQATQPQVQVQEPPGPPPGPALYLPPPEKDHSLPRAYRAERLGAVEAAVRKQAGLAKPPAADPWCDAYRALQDPYAASVGYQFAGGKVGQLVIRYKPEKPVEPARALEEAVRAWGPAGGQYQHRTGGGHLVSYWEDAKTLLKLDVGNEGGDRRLAALVLMDKAATLARAVTGK